MRVVFLNSLPNCKTLALSKLKAFAEANYMLLKIKFVSHRIENIMGYLENGGYQLFLFFPQCSLWDKEKMLVTSIFSFSYNVFKRLFFSGQTKLCDKVLDKHYIGHITVAAYLRVLGQGYQESCPRRLLPRNYEDDNSSNTSVKF